MNSFRSDVKDEGIILHKKRLLSEHVMITVFSKNSGKLLLVAKGIRQFTSKRNAHLQTGNVIVFGHTQNPTGASYITHASLVSHLLVIKEDPSRLRLLYLILFLLDSLLPQGVSDPEMYSFCRHTLVKIGNIPMVSNSEKLAIVNETLSKLGYQAWPSFEECISSIEEIIGKKIPHGVL